MSTSLPPREEVESLAAIGITAFTTTRDAGDFALAERAADGGEHARERGAVVDVADPARARWHSLLQSLAPLGATRLASATQVHGTRVLAHEGDWAGWIRVDGADGHFLPQRGAAAITIADCVPVFLAHPNGSAAVVHAGWRGVAGGILVEAIRAFAARDLPAHELVVHFGPSICGRCYEVGPDVYRQLTGWETKRARHVDLRALLAEQAVQFGVRSWSASGDCTRCDNDRFFSHRAGDAGRQVALIVANLTA